MINEYIFDIQIDKLKEVFGDRFFTDSRKKLIWNGVKNLSDKWFEETVGHFLNCFRQSPLPNDFFEAARIEKNKLGGPPDRIGNCLNCGGYGSYMTEENGIKRGWQCTCEAGYQLAGGLPKKQESLTQSHNVL